MAFQLKKEYLRCAFHATHMISSKVIKYKYSVKVAVNMSYILTSPHPVWQKQAMLSKQASHNISPSSIDHRNYFQTSKGFVTLIIWKVNRILTHCGVAYESVYSLARDHVTRVCIYLCQIYCILYKSMTWIQGNNTNSHSENEYCTWKYFNIKRIFHRSGASQIIDLKI